MTEHTGRPEGSQSEQHAPAPSPVIPATMSLFEHSPSKDLNSHELDALARACSCTFTLALILTFCAPIGCLGDLLPTSALGGWGSAASVVISVALPTTFYILTGLMDRRRAWAAIANVAMASFMVALAVLVIALVAWHVWQTPAVPFPLVLIVLVVAGVPLAIAVAAVVATAKVIGPLMRARAIDRRGFDVRPMGSPVSAPDEPR